jgi:hypothetical protein
VLVQVAAALLAISLAYCNAAGSMAIRVRPTSNPEAELHGEAPSGKSVIQMSQMPPQPGFERLSRRGLREELDEEISVPRGQP